MHIFGSLYVHGTQAVSGPHHAARVAEPAADTAQPVDELDLSSAAQFVDQVRELPEIRSDRVAALRDAISSGAYETDEKLDTALSRLLDELF